MRASGIDSARLLAERERLYGAGAPGGVRALVLALARPADWAVLGQVWQGVQTELGWPAPGIAVSGTDACQLWFSLAEPVTPAEAHALLERLRLRYLADVPAHRVELLPSADGRRLAPVVPSPYPDREGGGGEVWSAYVAPDLAPVFAETPWLDIPPRAEGQAELLSRLRPISAAEGAVLRSEAAAVPSSAAIAPAPATSTTGAFADPRAFLLQVMNDERVEMGLRIEAAKALLGAPARSRATGAAGATSTPRRKSAAPEAG